jgi:Fe-S cluster assembly scaffold protein SufB
VARLLSLSDTDPSGYLVPAINSKDKKFLDEAVELLSKYDSFAKRFGYDYRKSPIADFDPRPYSYELQDALTKKTPICEETLSSLPKTEEKLASLLGKAPTSLDDHEGYESFVKAIAALSFEPQSLFAKATRDAVRKNLVTLEAEQTRLASEAHALDGEINLVEDIPALTNLVSEEKKGYGVFFLFNKKFKANGERLKKVVLIKGSREEKLKVLERELTYLHDVALFKKSLKDNLVPFDKSYDEGLGTSFSQMIALIDYLESASKKGYFLNAYKPVYEKLDFRANLKKAASEYSGKTKKLVTCYKALQPSFTGSKKNLAKLDYSEVLAILKGLEPYFVDAREVSLYRDWLDKARNKGLLDFLNKSLSASLPSEALPRIYEKDFLVEEIHLQIAKSPLLAKFSRAEHEKLVAKFSLLDEEQYKISTLMISERVGSRRPDPNNQSGASPVGMIMREAQKSTRLMPTRYLLQHYFSTVSNIKPVFLMSPLSVATYLLPEAQFDLVVFDEASQIYPEDALGAIYRAKQAIIVGDSRQLPPTSFFVATEDESEVSDEDYEEDDSSLESILDLASAYLPPERLLWHYRSKNEELIAFSNKEFYNSALYSFPAASKKEEDGIHLHYLADGVYEAGKRTNEKEASYIADLVFKLGHEYPLRSIGVVAFSEAQMNLIDDKVETRRLSDKSLDNTLFAMKEEPFFVKNLETVQGDERDIMIISVCYGKDKDGRFYQRFGPLNNEGGERRLNVAITRAKYALELVTSIHGSDIDTSKTASEGARQLKNYLDFAANPVVVVHAVSITLEAGASFTLHLLNAGGRLGRYALDVTLHEGASFTLNAAQIGSGAQTLEIVSTITHAEPGATSRQTVRSILCDGATGTYLGKVAVARDAQQTDSEQSVRAMLLDRHSTANAVPELEIFADDVKCAHGCAVGELDAMSLFYLQSRGLDQGASKRLLLQAFVAERVRRRGRGGTADRAGAGQAGGSGVIASTLRADFPGLANNWHYLDTAATAQKPRQVLDAMMKAGGVDYATVHRGVYARSANMTLAYEAARRRVASFIGGQEDEIVFVRGATEAINLVAHSFSPINRDSPYLLKEEPRRVLLSQLEHHSNIVPWQLAGWQVDVCPLTPDGRIDLDAAEAMLTPDHKMVAFAHVSNVLGSRA